MQTKPFQIYFSEKHYNQLYDETESQWIQQNYDKEIYSVKKRGEQNQTLIAKKYTYQKDDFIDEVWEEVNSVIKMKNKLHPNIIKYESMFMYDTQENDIDYQVCIMIMEKGEQTLEEFLESTLNKDQQQLQSLEDSGKTLKKNQKANQQQQQQQQNYENLIYQYLKQTLSGCKYLQSLNIHHRDYKPTNIVLINNQVKIIDFDIAIITQFDFTQEITSLKGTLSYMDPNLISIFKQMGQQDDEEDQEIKYNLQKTEIYSIGCTFLQLAMKWNRQQLKKYNNNINYYLNNEQYQLQESYLQKVTSQIQHKKLKQILCNILDIDLKKRWDLNKCIQYLDLDQNQDLQQLQHKQIEVEDNNNKQEWLTNEYIEQLEREKFTIQLKQDNLISKEDVNNTRYLDIQVKQEIKNFSEQQIDITSIFKNFQLIKLNISLNQISPDLINQLFSILPYCKNLRLLNLQIGDHNKISEGEAIAIGSAIEKLTTLQQLHLSIGKNNKIGQLGTKHILSSIENLTTLQDLQLIIQDDNDIKEQGAKSIGSALEKLTSLQKLKLIIGWDNNIEQEGANSIGSALKKLHSLKELYLTIESNNIGQQGVKSIGLGLEKLSTLLKLRLAIGWDNNIGEEGAKFLGMVLKQLNSLQELHLVIGCWNNIREQGASSIGQAIQKLTTLKDLHIIIEGNNDIGKQGAQSIVFALLELKDLDKMYLQIEEEKYYSKQDLLKLL